MGDIFRVVVLGCGGGPYENDMPGYLLYPTRDPEQLIALDAGTFLAGMEVAAAAGSLSDFTFTSPTLTHVGELFIHTLKAYLISHAHLDHIFGFVMASQNDSAKPILAIESTLTYLKEHIFNWAIWANMANEGCEPCLNRYQYISLPLDEPRPIPRTQMTAEAHLLSHPGAYPSSAFFVSYGPHTVLYLGDTSPDSIEKAKHLSHIWQRAGRLIREKKLCGIFLECSFPEEEASKIIYGHLSPKTMLAELRALRDAAGTSLEGLKVIVTHRKTTLEARKNHYKTIADELIQGNDLGIHFIFPTRGERISL